MDGAPLRLGTVMPGIAAHRALSERGAAFRVSPRIVTGDQLAADFRDPDGNVLSILGPRRV